MMPTTSKKLRLLLPVMLLVSFLGLGTAASPAQAASQEALDGLAESLAEASIGISQYSFLQTVLDPSASEAAVEGASQLIKDLEGLSEGLEFLSVVSTVLDLGSTVMEVMEAYATGGFAAAWDTAMHELVVQGSGALIGLAVSAGCDAVTSGIGAILCHTLGTWVGEKLGEMGGEYAWEHWLRDPLHDFGIWLYKKFFGHVPGLPPMPKITINRIATPTKLIVPKMPMPPRIH